ncbi:SMP-30/gluconolactonase/LRE family protein [Conexibacter sp. JD483]|uniref:SMP-30/gluconolactonase/LRE family protein n=1 Tax=unclassified Conexibacter TaxID=2627773 RepID=UPI00271F1E18|nr:MULTISPECIES: SMP-30/gluconolactonase/LRE family protein [unclassified Conexibacter]MDO8189135.1 SMP-30/gluconolactonase/LRE family protein [Conexibacter sp. CPCC 205706]MDO8201847.1 SMP-30/gluconolactonase/LRE family protein [Conexibacter sp. CPCC 205762]MDR9371843.1 SMP-30/gluconolactonase/LRE family protein [Conexibacter sp. JD483]
MSPIRSTAVTAAALIAAASAAPASAKTITLPAGFSAEAMTAHRGALFVSSQTSGEVRRIDPRSGQQTVLVKGRRGNRGNGLRFAGDNRLIVAGGTNGKIDVYDGRSGRLIRRHSVPGAGFLNGVAVQGKTAYVTDTLTHLIHALPTSGRGTVRTIRPGGDFTPDRLDLDGIILARPGWLLTGQYGSGKLFAFSTKTGATRQVTLNASLPTNDGLALRGRTLFVAENRGKVQVVRLSADLASGRVTQTLPRGRRLRNPVDLALIGGHLWVLDGHVPGDDPARTARQVDRIIDLGRF